MVTACPLSLKAAQQAEITLLKTEIVAGLCGVVKISQKSRRASLSAPAGCPSHCPQGESHMWAAQLLPLAADVSPLQLHSPACTNS